MGDTLAQLERKLNPKYIVRDHPLAALGVAFGTGVALGTTRPDATTAHTLRTQLRQGRAHIDHSASTMVDEIMHGITTALVTAGGAKLMQLAEALIGHPVTPANGNEPGRQHSSMSRPQAQAPRAPLATGRRW